MLIEYLRKCGRERSVVGLFIRRDVEDGGGYSDKGFDTFVCPLFLSKSNKTKEERRGYSIQWTCEERDIAYGFDWVFFKMWLCFNVWFFTDDQIQTNTYARDNSVTMTFFLFHVVARFSASL